jgi:hypothetical protein
MIFYIIHMICEAHPVMFDRFLGLQVPSKVRSAMQNAAILCKTLLFCAMYDPQHQPIQPSALSEKRNTGSLSVAKAVYGASVPGVTSFEYFIRSREANKTRDEAQHVSKTRHSFVRRWLDKKPIGQHTDELVWRIPGPALPSFGHRNTARWCLFTCFRTPTDRDCGECWGGHI